MKQAQKIFGGILLVAGTSIGAGILALPVSTAEAGFLPSVFAFLVNWFFMTLSAFYLVEISLISTGEADLVSMAERTLGPLGKWITTLLYLSLFYALISAYLKGGSAWVLQIIDHAQIRSYPNLVSIALAILLGGIVCFGTEIVDKFNRILTFGLFASYCVLILLLSEHMQFEYLQIAHMEKVTQSFSIIVTAFGFAVIIPSLASYLDRDPKALKKVILIGSLLPLTTYILWEMVILGSIPGLSGATGEGVSIAVALEKLTQNEWTVSLVKFFSVFALLTSFLGVSLALFHFMADFLGWKINHKTRIPLFCLTYMPSLSILFFYPKAFFQILSFAGIFVALLLGILPILMAWRSRSQFNVLGGPVLLASGLCFFVGVILEKIF